MGWGEWCGCANEGGARNVVVHVLPSLSFCVSFFFFFLFLFYLFLFIFIFCQVEFTWKANLVFRQEELTGLDRKFKICQLMYFKISLAISKTSTIQIKFDPNLKFIVQLPIILRRIKK